MQTRSVPFTAILVIAACSGSPTAPSRAPDWPPFEPPQTRTVDVVDDYHGTEVADPFRWLEDQDGDDVAKWVRTQNAFTRSYLDRIAARPQIRSRLQELWNYPRYGPPVKAGTRWIYGKNDGLQNQAVYRVTDDLEKEGRVLLDLNRASAEGTVALAGFALTEDGDKLAYATSSQGSDWKEWNVLDVATGERLSDHLRWSKFGGAAWTHDGQGFFYQRYPAPAEGETFEAQNFSPRLCYHRLGTSQEDDLVVYEAPEHPDWGFAATVTEEGRYLVIHVSVGTDRRNRVAYVDLQDEGWSVRPLLMEFDAGYDFCGNDGGTFWFHTDNGAPLGRIIAVDAYDPDPGSWVEVVPETDHVLENVSVVADRWVLKYLEDASHRLRIVAFDGTVEGTIDLPDLGNVSRMTGKRSDRETFFSFTSFLHPASVYRYDFASKSLSVFREAELDVDRSEYVIRQVFPQSPDGTRLSMFLVHRKELRLNGTNPTLLYGYGGFDISLTPGFSVPTFAWLERGGVYALAILRGGGEYGERWHEQGMLGNKQNVFDDFMSCAEYLQRNGYCTRDKLAITGGSNGGLLVGAVLTQRPDIIGAAVPRVGVMDMLRYHEFTIGWAWASEYGRSDDPEQFVWLRSYSPLHNVVPGTKYPPTLILTGDHDDRVLPGHSYKFAAALQRAQSGDAPVLIRIETDTGHGAGKPLAKTIDEEADILAFLVEVLGA